MSLQDNFKPPQADLDTGQTRTPLWKALLAALALDIFGSLVAGLIMQEILLIQGYSAQQLQEMFVDGFPVSLTALWLVVPGCLFSVWAGALLIHKYRSPALLPPLLLFVLQTLFTLLFYGAESSWSFLAMSMLNLALLFGGWMLGYARLKKKGVFSDAKP
ncbi:hypothetical protein V8J88_03205 [Massilia sp. W12]|uniref:hypothetical protein n=1 Tax=Massilia sp. W12 TaxID=3126507 RepID=UPI0030CD8723